MSISEKVLDYTLLAEFAYLKLENYKFEYNDIDKLENFIENKDESGIEIARQDKIKSVLEKYEIINFESFDAVGESDLQMMLLKDKSTGEYVISYRGTAGFVDAFFSDFQQMGLKLGANQQFKDSLTVTNYWKELYGLNSSNTTLSGHSLGGALAQLNSYYYGFPAYTINAFGFDAATSGISVTIDAYLTNQEILDNAVKNTDNIYNYISVAGNYPDFIAGGLTDIVGGLENTHIGEINLVKDISGGYFGGLLGSHSSIDINNSLEIYYDLMQTFNITNEELTSIIDSVHRTVGNQFLRTLDRIVDILGIEFKEDLLLLSKEILSKKDDNLSIGKINFTTYEDILNSNDNSKLYALINQIPFTISSSNVDLYQNFDISNMSESELNDRGLMYEYIINNSSFLELEANYINNDTGIKLQTLRDIPTVIFGSNDETKKETIYTQKTNDRIYAGKGDDTIIAWGGNNLYDGGEGNDTVSYKTLQSKEGITLNLSLTTAQIINSTTTDTLVNIENVIGSRYADNIIGKDNSNSIITLKGGFGNDTLTGGDNTVENKLYGEENNDYLYGGSTSDEIMLNANKLVKNYLYGGSGEDFLVASINADNELYGGDDKDILISELIGYEHSKFGVLKGSSYLNGGIGDDQYYVSDKVTIEDDDNSGEIIISRTMQKLSELKYKFSPNGTVVFYTLEPTIVTETSYPFAGLGGFAGSVLGNKGITTTRIDYNEKYLGIVSRNGNDLIIDYFDRANITIKNYNFVTGSLGLTITGDMLSDNPQTPSEPNPIVIGSDESETLVGSEVNNTYTSNKGNDTIKDTAGGNDTYNFSLGDGADTIYDIKGNDVIKFDDTVIKEDITFSQSEDLKSLIINYSSTDSITITNYFDSFSKIENIQLSDGTKLTPQFNNTITGRDISENIVTGYGNDTISANAGDDTIKDLSGDDTYTFKVGDGADTIEDLSGIDTLQFANLSKEDLFFTQKNNNLVINYSTSDSVTIVDYFDTSKQNSIEKITFKTDTEIIDASNIITGTTSADNITGTYFDDVITSGSGNDTLKGFYGNDTYVFSKGDGNNRIYDVKGDDTIAFDETVLKEDISFSIKDNNLLITYSTTDTIEVLDYFNTDRKIENIKLSTGEILNVTNINKTITGSEQNDTLIGSYGDDILIGNDGDDTLNGNVGKDKLYGGRGFDTYVASHGDIINDSDNLGEIIFEGNSLSQTAIYDENKKVYVSSIGEYSLEDTTLTFTSNTGKKLIIENFDKDNYSLGINLTNEGRAFSTQTLYSNVLVVDLNKDGFINTNSLSNSNTYFDITNNSFKEKTQWLDNSDGFLVLDKNSDGVINSSDEFFGNLSKSGFKELEELVDLNYDNVIDRKDSMFYQLKIWQDLNSDGISTSNELFELVDAGILSINLDTSLRDAVDTNITIDEAIEDVLEFKKLVA